MAEKTIVFADKSPEVRKKVSSLLKKEGYEVITAKDGIEALKKVVSETPNLLLISNSLPGIKGYQVCKYIKNDPQMRTLPVIIMAPGKERNRLEKMLPGQAGFLEGSGNSEKLLSAVGMVFKNGEAMHRTKDIKKVPYAKSEEYLLERTLDSLDRKIDEESFYQRMRAIALDGNSFEEAVEMIMQLLLEVVSFNAAVVYFHEDFRSKVLMRMLKPVKEDFINRFKGIVFDCLAGKKVYCDSSEMDLKIVKGPDEGEETLSPDRICFFGEHIIIDGHVRGFMGFSLSSSKEKTLLEENGEFYRSLLHHAFIILERAYLKDKLMRLSTTDELTLINNRHRIIDVLKKELLRARRYFLDLSVILFDIDNFKTINDFYGYQVGDVILRDISRVTVDTMRSIDEVGRYGGEEFLVILPETNLKNGSIAGNRLKNRVIAHTFPGIAKDIKVSLSIGVTGYLRDVDIGVDDLLRRTDQSLCEAKKRGKNCVYVMSK